MVIKILQHGFVKYNGKYLANAFIKIQQKFFCQGQHLIFTAQMTDTSNTVL